MFTATDGGYAKRTNVDEYRVQGRGGLGIKAAKMVRGPWLPRRRAGGRGDRRDPRHHAVGRCDSYASQRDQGNRP
ncbi:DNA gyrase C-terminal beta-propeller domain-containing protein [Streptomyces purpurascens]